MPTRSAQVLGAICSAVLVACGGLQSVDVDPYDPEPGTEDACRSLVEALPSSIGNAAERELSGSAAVAAAWGDPPIVLRCGVPPAQRPLDEQLFSVDGVDWTVDEGDGGSFFTTVGRMATVEVAVPSEYAPEAGVLTELATAIEDNVPTR